MNERTRLEKMIQTGFRNIGGMIVQKDADVVYENYWNESNQTTGFHIFSVTKSIVGLLIGIALEQGAIESLDQKVLEFFPEFQVKRGDTTIQQITLRHLMTMTAPYKFKKEPYQDYFTSEDWVKFSLAQLGGKGKIGEFRYAPIIGPDILSAILVRTTNQSVKEYEQKYLFDPLGIQIGDTKIFADKKEQLAWYEEKDTSGWVASPTGIHTAGWGLSLTVSDMARIGQLCLQKGNWNGIQVIPEGWIQNCTSAQQRMHPLSYGYLWWVVDEKEHSFVALGDGGNGIYVNPARQLVVAVAARMTKRACDLVKFIKKYVLPACDC